MTWPPRMPEDAVRAHIATDPEALRLIKTKPYVILQPAVLTGHTLGSIRISKRGLILARQLRDGQDVGECVLADPQE